MTDSKKQYNRRRKWAPKARTGCRTCKTRHVKCDETKPICRRCVLSGFRCDGYINSPKSESSPPSETQVTSPVDEEVVEHGNLEPATNSQEVLEVTDKCSSDLLVNPRTPYQSPEQQHALKFFIDMTAGMVGRSKAGNHFWKIIIPQAAWAYPAVRHALMASAILNESLCKRESRTGRFEQSELRALNYTNLAIKSLVTESVPMDVVLLASAIFGILDLFSGNWNNACIHINTGAKLAKQAKQLPVSDPFISFYCTAFASALPSTLQQDNTNSTSQKPPPKNADPTARLHEAVCSLKLALASFKEALPRLDQYNGPLDKDRIIHVINTARTEVEWLLTRWEDMLDNISTWESPGNTGPMVDIRRVESPWSECMKGLNRALSEGGDFDVPKFEVAMERTLPFFAFAHALSNTQMREDGAELLYRGGLLRGRNITPFMVPPPQASPPRRNSAPLVLRHFPTPEPDLLMRPKS